MVFVGNRQKFKYLAMSRCLGRAPVFNRERVHSQPPQMVIFVSVTSVRLHALRQQAMVTGCHQSIYGSGGWPVVCEKKENNNREEIEMMIIIIQYKNIIYYNNEKKDVYYVCNNNNNNYNGE